MRAKRLTHACPFPAALAALLDRRVSPLAAVAARQVYFEQVDDLLSEESIEAPLTSRSTAAKPAAQPTWLPCRDMTDVHAVLERYLRLR